MKNVIGLVLALVLCGSNSMAAVDMFLKVDGIPGESRDKLHAGEIDVLAFSWGLSNSGSFSSGGATAGKANFQDLSITKYADKATPQLMLHTANGKHIPQVVLTLRRATGEMTNPMYLKITLKQVMVTSVSTGGSGGDDRLVENISLNFAEVQVEYHEQKADGSTSPAGSFTWNIAENVAE